MRTLLVLVPLALALAGCIAPTPESSTDAAAAGDSTEMPAGEPAVVDWSGVVFDSETEVLSHQQPSEQAIWPIQQEGFLLHVAEVPQAMEVSLDWEGAGEMMIMLHSHKADGTNTYVEHITDMDDANPKCLRVPAADLAEGHWQIMVHSRGMTQVPFNLHVATWGGEAALDDSEYHGHWPQDGAFEVDEHAIEACAAARDGAAAQA